MSEDTGNGAGLGDPGAEDDGLENGFDDEMIEEFDDELDQDDEVNDELDEEGELLSVDDAARSLLGRSKAPRQPRAPRRGGEVQEHGRATTSLSR